MIDLIVLVLVRFVKRKFRPAPAHSPTCPARGKRNALFCTLLLLFLPGCGNIIRQYVLLHEYALVAQPVEHLTFNQRARDSSSLERTKKPRRFVRVFAVFSFPESLHTTGADIENAIVHCYNKIVVLSPKIQDAKRLRLANIQEERMVTGAIKNKVDKIWTDIWAGGITNPLTVIEQLTYLMFILSLIHI